MSKKIIGILTWRDGKKFEEPLYLRRLVLEGKKLGAEVFLFSHQDVFAGKRKIRGFVPLTGGGWEGRWFSWPDIVIDRYRKRVDKYLEIRHSKLFTYTNSPFGNKWNVTQILMADEQVRQWVPQTAAYSAAMLRQMIKQFPLLYMKPGNGTGGRSIMKITKRSKGFGLLGSSKKLEKKAIHLQTEAALISWCHKWVKEQRIRKGNFMIQQGLDLELLPNRTVDVRLLIQKNNQGEWEVTGQGVRVSPRHSATSNLHAGGKAVSFESFMTKRFGAEKMEEIRQECHKLALKTAESLENRFGRMMEFGLDLGVDVNGYTWLIEVNPKPGREIFREIGQLDTYEEAIRKPLLYALHLVAPKAAVEESGGEVSKIEADEEKADQDKVNEDKANVEELGVVKVSEAEMEETNEEETNEEETVASKEEEEEGKG